MAASEIEVAVREPWTPRHAFKTTLLVSLVVAVFVLLYMFRHVLLLMFLAIVLATALQPVATWLNRRGLPWSASVVLTFVIPGVFLVIAGFLWLPLLLDQASETMKGIPDRYAGFRNSLIKSSHWELQRAGQLIPPRAELFDDTVGHASIWNHLWNLASRVTSTAFHLGLAGLAMCLLAGYWLTQSQRTIQALLMAVKPERRKEVQELVTQMEDKVGAYVRGQGVLCLCVFVLSLIGYAAIGLPGALFLATIAGVLEAVPMLGPVLSAVPPMIVAASEDPQKIVWVLAVAIAIQQLENYLLVPRIMDNAVGVNAIVTLLGMVAFATLFGPLGAVLAIPLSAIVQLVVERYVLSRQALEPPKPAGRDEVHRLRYQTQELVRDIRLLLRHGDDETESAKEKDAVEEAVEAIATDLDHYLAVVAGDTSSQAVNTEQVLAP